jgi:NADH-quinone oxidoreductase subunit F
MASVCEQIIGNCLCVLGDAMAMPIGSMIKHFREEFEAHIEAARERNGLGAAIPQVNRGRNAGPGPMLEPAGTDPSAVPV